MPVVGDDHHLAVLDVAHEAGADDVERAGLRGQDVAAVELAEHQRADAERVAGADQLLVGERDERVGALDLAQRVDEAVDDARLAAAGDEVEDHLGVGGRLEDRAVADELAPQGQAVGQVAVMGDREAAAVEFGEERLDVAQDRPAGGRVADVADGASGPAAARWSTRSEKLSPTRPSWRSEWKTLAVEGDDAGRFLAAMLQGVQAERRDGRGVGMAEDAEDAAFLAQRVAVEVEVRGRARPAASRTMLT